MIHLSELHYNLGHVLQQQGNLREAAIEFQRSIDLQPDFAQAHHSLAVVFNAQGRVEAAKKHYQAAIALQPHAVQIYNNLGCLLIEQGQIEQALIVYQRALVLQPDSAILSSNFGRAIALQDPIKAIQAYRRAIQLDPNLIEAHYHLGQALQRQGSQDAIAAFEQVLRLDPMHAAAHISCGILLAGLGNIDRALVHFQQSLLPQKPYIQAFCRWVNQLQGEDELTLARKACGAFLTAVLPANQNFHQNFQTVTDTPRPQVDSLARSYLAQTYHRWADLFMRYGGTQQYQQAEAYYQKAIHLQPTLERYEQLIHCLKLQQRWNAAIFTSQLALTLYPNAPQIYRSLGDILEQQGRWEAAIAYYQKALNRVLPSLAELDGTTDAMTTVVPDTATSSAVASIAATVVSKRKQGQTAQRLQSIATTSAWIQTTPYRYQDLSFQFYSDLNQSHLVNSPQSSANLFEDNRNSIACLASSEAESDFNSNSECGGINCHRCLKEITDRFYPIHLGHHIYTCEPQLASRSAHHYFVAHLPQAQAWSIPQQTAWLVTHSIAILTPDQQILADVSREYPGQLPDCDQSPRFERMSQVYIQSSEHPVEQITGRVAALASLSGHNYFHWMVDVLPRFELLRRADIQLSQIDWFWLNEPQFAFQQQSLQLLGIPFSKVLSSDRHPRIQAEQLIVPSFAGHLGWIEPWALQFLRQQFLPATQARYDRFKYERIYISRAQANHRRLLNEAEILAELIPLGFVAVELESLSLSEQIALFAQAKVIVAPHGGGLTNLVFCQPETIVVELFAPSYVRHYYWGISQQLGLRHYFIKGEELTCSPIQQLMYPSALMADIWLEPTTLKAILNHLKL